MKLPRRKVNRIENYNYSVNGAYFVTICTQDRKQILSHIVGDGFPVPTSKGDIAEDFIQRISEKYPNTFVDNYVVMPDHIHMLLRISSTEGMGNPSPTLGRIIGWYKYQTSKQINMLHNTPGEKVFQRSYYDHVIRNQQDYNEVWEYIEHNPQKWIITKQGRD